MPAALRLPGRPQGGDAAPRILLIEDDADDCRADPRAAHRHLRPRAARSNGCARGTPASRRSPRRATTSIWSTTGSAIATACSWCARRSRLGAAAPFIVLTGQGSREIDLAAMRAGAVGLSGQVRDDRAAARARDPLRDRAPSRRAAARGARPVRPADRARQPGAVPRLPAQDPGARRAASPAGRGHAARPRPLQDRQRHLRPRGRATCCSGRSPSACAHRCARAIWSRASAATSSRW